MIQLRKHPYETTATSATVIDSATRIKCHGK